MFKRYVRGWHLVAGLLAIAVVGVAVAVYLTRDPKLEARAMAVYFPERDSTVTYIDFAAMRSSGVLDQLIGTAVTEEPDYRKFVEQVGFDYKRDLDRVMLNSSGGVHYFLVQGRFDWDKLSNYAKQNGGRCDTVVCSLTGSTPDRIISYRLLKPSLLAMASAKNAGAVKAIERRSAPVGFEIPDKPVWVSTGPESLRSFSQLPSGTKLFAKALENAERVSFALGPAQDRFELTMNVLCRGSEDAAVLKAQLEGVTSLLAKLILRESQKPNAGDLSGVLTSGAFERDDRRVIGRWPIARAFLESLGRTS